MTAAAIAAPDFVRTAELPGRPYRPSFLPHGCSPMTWNYPPIPGKAAA
jgi:hypothetical protein